MFPLIVPPQSFTELLNNVEVDLAIAYHQGAVLPVNYYIRRVSQIDPSFSDAVNAILIDGKRVDPIYRQHQHCPIGENAVISMDSLETPVRGSQ